MTRHFLEMDDLDDSEVQAVLSLSERRDPPRVLEGQGVAILLEKPSARTRNSMEMAVVQLGGHPVTIGPAEVALDVRESVEDVSRTLSCFHSLIAARVFDHSTLERMAAAAAVPVVNLLSDSGHPIQVLADLLTIRQQLGPLEGLTVAWIGDANNMAFSTALGCALTGMAFRVSHPPGYGFTPEARARLEGCGVAMATIDDPREAAAGADVICADAWYSMGQEDEREQRRAVFAPWRVTEDVMASAAERAIFLHCLPAHRGDEVVDEVLDGPRSRVWQQAENRMHSARGLLAWLLTAGA